MELDKLFGLPAHPLLVHIPVVLVPLAALFAIVFAFRPAWLDRYGWALVLLSGAGALGAILAAGSGETLQESPGIKDSAALRDHADMGEAARTVAFIFFLIVVTVVVLRYFARKHASADGFWKFMRSKAGAIVIAVALVVSAAGAMATIVKAGHQGAKVTWDQKHLGG